MCPLQGDCSRLATHRVCEAGQQLPEALVRLLKLRVASFISLLIEDDVRSQQIRSGLELVRYARNRTACRRYFIQRRAVGHAAEHFVTGNLPPRTVTDSALAWTGNLLRKGTYARKGE